MRTRHYWVLILIFSLLLCACRNTAPETEPTDPSTYEKSTTEGSDDATTSTTQDIPQKIPQQTEPEETTQPQHSALYLPQYAPEQILEYFREVVLEVEYSDGIGDTSLVQKWLAPIRYRITGTPSEEDLAILNDLFTQLNEIPGFPGIYEVEDGCFENLTIGFMDAEEFDACFYDMLGGEFAWGATQFWYYTDSNEIHTAHIGYRNDIDLNDRKSILIEEIINTLGITDTILRTDSIVYQYSDDNTALSDVDWVLVKLLYSPAIQCGMDYDSCAPIILELYY